MLTDHIYHPYSWGFPKIWFLPASYRTLSPWRPNLELSLITATLSPVPSKHASPLLASRSKPHSSLSWPLQTHPNWSPHRHSLSLPAHSLHSSKSNHCKISICTMWRSGWKHFDGFLISSEHLLDLSHRSSHHRPLCHLLSRHAESSWVPWTQHATLSTESTYTFPSGWDNPHHATLPAQSPALLQLPRQGFHNHHRHSPDYTEYPSYALTWHQGPLHQSGSHGHPCTYICIILWWMYFSLISLRSS